MKRTSITSFASSSQTPAGYQAPPPHDSTPADWDPRAIDERARPFVPLSPRPQSSTPRSQRGMAQAPPLVTQAIYPLASSFIPAPATGENTFSPFFDFSPYQSASYQGFSSDADTFSVQHASPTNPFSSGYPMPAPRPLYSGVLSTIAYLNISGHQFDNVMAREAEDNLSIDKPSQAKVIKFRKATGMIICIYTYGAQTTIIPIGTGILISNNQIVTAKHVIDVADALTSDPAYVLYVVFEYIDKEKTAKLFQAGKIVQHPDEDIAVVALFGEPGKEQGFIPVEYDDQLGGEYWVVHHAGGLPAQFSIGRIADHEKSMSYRPGHVRSTIPQLPYLLKFNLIIHAGPLASGAGVVNHADSACVGVLISRSTKLGAISREILRFYEVSDWLKCLLGQASIIPFKAQRLKIENFIATRISTDALYTNALEGPQRKLVIANYGLFTQPSFFLSQKNIDDTAEALEHITFADLWKSSYQNPIAFYQSIRIDVQNPTATHQNIQVQLNGANLQGKKTTFATILIDFRFNDPRVKPNQQAHIVNQFKAAISQGLNELRLQGTCNIKKIDLTWVL